MMTVRICQREALHERAQSRRFFLRDRPVPPHWQVMIPTHSVFSTPLLYRTHHTGLPDQKY